MALAWGWPGGVGPVVLACCPAFVASPVEASVNLYKYFNTFYNQVHQIRKFLLSSPEAYVEKNNIFFVRFTIRCSKLKNQKIADIFSVLHHVATVINLI